MTETFIALLFAHALADFVLQTRWIVDNKRRPHVLLLHGVIVLITAQAALGHPAAAPLLALAAAHVAIDAVKTYTRFGGLPGFMADQGAHLASIAAVAVLVPELWATGALATHLPGLARALPHAMLLGAALILALRAGDFAIRLLMAAHDAPAEDAAGLPNAGRSIGHLERLLILVLMLAGEITAIGFLVAAKSILRFGTVADNRRVTEYVIIGTLASFGWAMGVGLGAEALLSALPPVEITAVPPYF